MDDSLKFALYRQMKKEISNNNKNNNRARETGYYTTIKPKEEPKKKDYTLDKILTISFLILIITLVIIVFLHSADYNTHFTDESIGDLNLTSVDTVIYHYENPSTYNYSYNVNYEFDNVNSSLVGSEITTYLYNGNNLINNESITDINESTTIIEEDNVYKNLFSGECRITRNELIDITDLRIEVKNNGKIIYNITKPFDMNIKEL